MYKILVAVLLAGGMSGTLSAAEVNPAQDLARRPNNLALLPEKWIEAKPIQLTISFALRSAPNSAEANRFLKTLQAKMKALPQKMDLKIYRQLTPSRFQYTAAMMFPNWAEYRAHEQEPGFMAYYVEHWKPEVVDSEERLTVLDDETAR